MAFPSGSTDLRSLVDQHYELLYRFAYRLSGSAADAEDLTQETFCTAQQKIRQLRDSERARGWLLRILRNHYLGRIRHKEAISLDTLDGVAEEIEQPDSAIAVDTEQLQRTLGELPEAFRTVVILFYFEGFSYRESAEQLGVPIGTIMSRLARAKAYLRSRLRGEPVMARVSSSSPGVK